AARVPSLVSTMLTAMVQEDERGLGDWHAEWETLPQIFRLTGGSLHQMAEVVSHLEVDTKRMQQNLDVTQGLIFADAVTMALGSQIGKAEAHALVEAVSREAKNAGKHLREVLRNNKEVMNHLTTADLERLFKAENYLGLAEKFVDRVVASTQVAEKN